MSNCFSSREEPCHNITHVLMLSTLSADGGVTSSLSRQLQFTQQRTIITRSQAVARIADRTASQHDNR